jgi:hypothetical protein
MLYAQKLKLLRYQQHTYTIIGTIHRYLSKCLQRNFINNNHWILIQIHITTPNLHCTIYDSNTSRTKKLPNDTVQLLTKIISVEHLLYTYVNVIQQLDGSSCGLFTIAYVINMAFKFNLEQSIYIVPKIWLHVQNNINDNNTSPFPKCITITDSAQ